jgi:hypothetical protein
VIPHASYFPGLCPRNESVYIKEIKLKCGAEEDCLVNGFTVDSMHQLNVTINISDTLKCRLI